MRRWSRAEAPSLILVVCATLLAGCTTDEAPVGDDDPLLISDPDDYSYLNETNTSRAHIHDYWGGQDQRIIVAEGDAEYFSSDRWTPSNPIRPLDGETFPQGTGKVAFHVEWEDLRAGHYDTVQLWVKTAGDHEPLYLADVEKGDTVEMTVNNTQNDLPHQVVSNWFFLLLFERPSNSPLVGMDIVARIEAHAYRTLDIPAFPAHPGRWGGETSLPLLERSDETVALVQRAPGGRYCLVGGCFDTHTPDNGTIVPPDTDHVAVVLTRESPADLPLYLGVHGSGTTTFAVREPDETDGDTQRYLLTPDEARPDGPYAKQSQWEFIVYTSDDETFRPYSGGYALEATAHREQA